MEPRTNTFIFHFRSVALAPNSDDLAKSVILDSDAAAEYHKP